MNRRYFLAGAMVALGAVNAQANPLLTIEQAPGGMIEACRFVQGEIKHRLPAAAKFEDCSKSTGSAMAGVRIVETTVDGKRWVATVDEWAGKERKLISLRHFP